MTARRVDAVLVAGGKYHDIDFARRELLGLLAEHDHLRVRVQPDYEDTSGLDAASILVSYTCDVRPSERTQRAIHEWVEAGGRWGALHGTTAARNNVGRALAGAPRCSGGGADPPGTHSTPPPPIQPYRVEPSDGDHWLVAGIEPFDTDD